MSAINISTTAAGGLSEGDHTTIHTGTMGLKKFGSGAADPTVDEDIISGYAVGSIYLNTTSSKIFFCEDDTEGAASWVNLNAGLTIQTVTHTTANLATSTAEDTSVAIADSNITILAAKIEKTAGDSTSVSARLFFDDTFSSEYEWMFGRSGFGIDATSPVFGPVYDENIGDVQSRAIPYADLDDTSELHLRITNEDWSNTGTYQITIQYLVNGL